MSRFRDKIIEQDARALYLDKYRFDDWDDAPSWEREMFRNRAREARDRLEGVPVRGNTQPTGGPS